MEMSIWIHNSNVSLVSSCLKVWFSPDCSLTFNCLCVLKCTDCRSEHPLKEKFLWDKLPVLYGFLRLTSLHCSCNYHCCQLSWCSSCTYWMSRSYLANNSRKTGIASPLHPWLELDHLLLWASVIMVIFTSTARQETVKVSTNLILTKQGIGFTVHCCEVHEHAPCNNGVLVHQVPYDGVLWLLQKLQWMIQNVGLVMQKWHGNGTLPPVFDDKDCCHQSLGSFQLACKPTSLHFSKQKSATPPPLSWWILCTWGT